MIEKREHRAALVAAKPLSYWQAKAQAAFNVWIRVRDVAEPCISCERPASWHGQWHASHFHSVGSHPELRFDRDNVHKACSICNKHLSGNISGYRPRLIARIGMERFDLLEGPHPAAHYTREQLQGIIIEYRNKTKELEK